MKVLVACEESQAVTKEFRALGHDAYSCDILECSGGHPEWHIQMNVLNILEPVDDGELVAISFCTMDGEVHIVEKWDMIIAFPPCTYLTITGNRWFNVEKYGEKALKRIEDRKQAIDFFMRFANADCERIAIENPIGVMSSEFRKPDLIVHPYMFGDPERKSTCLWLKNLSNLEPVNIVEPKIIKYKNGKGTDSPWHMGTMNLPSVERSKMRSKTFPGIAKAMAMQWGIENI